MTEIRAKRLVTDGEKVFSYHRAEQSGVWEVNNDLPRFPHRKFDEWMKQNTPNHGMNLLAINSSLYRYGIRLYALADNGGFLVTYDGGVSEHGAFAGAFARIVELLIAWKPANES